MPSSSAARISWNNDSVAHNVASFVLEVRERPCVGKLVERIMRAARADAEPVDKEEQH